MAMLRATPLREKTLYTLTTLRRGRLLVRQAWLEGACLRSILKSCAVYEGRMSLG